MNSGGLLFDACLASPRCHMEGTVTPPLRPSLRERRGDDGGERDRLLLGSHRAMNELAVVLTLVGGWLFARTYLRTRSLLATAVEHAAYGCLLFTVGLGRWFVTGV